MRSESVIELSRYQQRSPEESASSAYCMRLRVRRQRIRYAAAVLAAAGALSTRAGLFVCPRLAFRTL